MIRFVTRREASRLLCAGAAGLCLAKSARAESLGKNNARGSQRERAIPSSGEKIPVIGLGTYPMFDVSASPVDRLPLQEVIAAFTRLGGKVIDSSPMYGRSEEVVGDLVAKLQVRESLFLASKVWTTGQAEGRASLERSARLLQTKTIDLMQVHNLVDLDTQLGTLREWQAQGRIRYLGITHYNSSAYREVEAALRRERLDFLQINYSLGEMEAGKRLLPLAQERGVAVLINRPLGSGALFRRVRGQALPEWASEFDCHSWAQFFLKWIIAHPAVTCVIPATGNPDHLADNMQAGLGRLPDEGMRKRMAETMARL